MIHLASKLPVTCCPAKWQSTFQEEQQETSSSHPPRWSLADANAADGVKIQADERGKEKANQPQLRSAVREYLQHLKHITTRVPVSIDVLEVIRNKAI